MTRGIWRYSRFMYPQVDTQFQYTLNEGDTPCIECLAIEKKFRMHKLLLKLETFNPTKSHKDRSIAYMISFYVGNGIKKFAIVSSGNAAASASACCKLAGCKLDIFLHPNTPSHKISRIKYGKIHFSKRPKFEAIRFANNTNAVLLRGSTSPYALEGYKSLAMELSFLDSSWHIFIPSSSGTCAVGLYLGLKKILKSIPRFVIVQTPNVYTLIKNVIRRPDCESKSLATAIVDRVGKRRYQVQQIVKLTNGYGVAVDNETLKLAFHDLQTQNIDCTYDGAISVAGLYKTFKNGISIKKAVCLITG